MKGLTIIELLLVITLIAMVAASGAPIYANFLSYAYLKNKTNETVSSLQTAKINAVSGKENSRWGVSFSSSAITLFKGSSFATRDTAFDITYQVPGSITVSGTAEVIFIPPNATPSSTASITISNNLGESNTISINQIGSIDLN